MSADPIRVLIVDDHAVVRKGVRLILADTSDIDVRGEAATAQQAIDLARQQEFDVALIDIALPDRNGLELLRSLRAEHPRLAVLMLSTYSEDIYALRAVRLGAAGYLTKESSEKTMTEAIRTAASGHRYLSPTLAERMAGMLTGALAPAHENLSNRELQVMRLIASGESLASIAHRLHLSPNTVTTYRTRILEKMQMRCNADLTRYAMENGLLR
ncbi:response regulator [Noviherbaspirillum galbum]|uniref:Response regulator transcription factor n=1 Tax=Noviherbaspirillum galbum TaxID=2709383 RepID=A0A6B3SSL8_9BURK|nr:response regulator transcription factor [Noviherbaspirillum galbum]NEX62345.1 response regulator transcription factor [Noviherbaspirillum galbum]